MQALPNGATLQAEGLHQTWSVFVLTGLGVAAIVYALILWCLLRYRKVSDVEDYPSQVRSNTAWEIAYTLIPIAIVVALFFVTYSVEHNVETLSPTPAVVIDVTGFRWSWRFAYPALNVSIVGTPDNPPILVLPAGEIARMNVISVDVDHSFWVPAFLFKRDAIPGFRNAFDWTPNKIGTFRGECAEFCGLEHTKMSFIVKVVSPQDFQRWAGEHRS